jgi:ATP-binding cassette subfamily A (ABC1) protein 3
MSMLTGLLSPTGGAASLFGHDLVNDLTAARKLLGVCPQHDILWPTLSVQQHLHLVGALKGLEPESLEQFVSEAVREVDLQEKFNSEVRYV